MDTRMRVGIEILPGELLGYIWSFVDEDPSGPETPHILAAVSRRWRNLALSTAHLWSRLFVAQEQGTISGELNLRLKRNMGVPLTIRFIRTSLEVLKVLGERLDSWGNISIGSGCYVQVLTFLSEQIREHPSKTPTESLKEVTLALTFGCRAFSGADARIWPNLRTFNITCSSLSKWLPLLPSTITSLSLITTRMTGLEFQALAQACPNIQTLYLTTNIFKSNSSGYELPLLQSLKEVKIGESGPVELLQALSSCGPNFHTLIWTPRSIVSSFIPSKSNRQLLITRLEIYIRGLVPYASGLVPSLLSVCPNIQVLILTQAPDISKGRVKSAELLAIEERKLVQTKGFMRDVIESLLDPKTQGCPSLSVIEIQNMPIERSYLPPLAELLIIGAKHSGSIQPRMSLHGCTGISLEDCETIKRLVKVDFE